MNYVTSKVAQQFFNVSRYTLSRWAEEGKIDFIKTKGGHRHYKLPSSIDDNSNREKIIYARVSSKKQESDLQRQINHLKSKYPEHTVVSDIGSGTNFKRKGFTSILDKVFNYNIEEIVVYSDDRLSRFSSDLIKFIFRRFHTKLICETSNVKKSPDVELAEDVISIITTFTSKYYGRRKYDKTDI